MNTEDPTLIRVEHLKKHFPIERGFIIKRQVGQISAVDGISFTIRRGETFGLVGESGCGKSTAARTILYLYRPTAGEIYYRDTELGQLTAAELRQARQHLQIIFQDPYASLDPRMTVGALVAEPLEIHRVESSANARRTRVLELLERVGLSPDYVNRYPHEFSGGQRQRIGIARALALDPEFIVCDEPISALDVSIQAQVVNLLQDLQNQLGLTYLFIAHDLSMVRHLADRVAVMYLGKLMELAPNEELYTNALHPYTQALLSAVPIPEPAAERKREQIILTGDVPSPASPPSGCPFHTRCPIAVDHCKKVEPTWREVSRDHWVYCHLVEPDNLAASKISPASQPVAA